RRRHTRFKCDWSSDVCSSDLIRASATAVACRRFVGASSAAGVSLAVFLPNWPMSTKDPTEYRTRWPVSLSRKVAEQPRQTTVERSEERRVGKERTWTRVEQPE